MASDDDLELFRAGIQTWENNRGSIPRKLATVFPVKLPVFGEPEAGRSWPLWVPRSALRPGPEGQLELGLPVDALYRMNRRVPAQLRTIRMMEEVEARRRSPAWEVAALASLFGGLSYGSIASRAAYGIACRLGEDLGVADSPDLWNRQMWQTLPGARPERYQTADSPISIGLVVGAELLGLLHNFLAIRVSLQGRGSRAFKPAAWVTERLDKTSIGSPARSGITWVALQKDELQARVWEAPLDALSQEFGVSAPRIARLCKDLGVTAPPQGYWLATPSKQAAMKCALLEAAGGEGGMTENA